MVRAREVRRVITSVDPGKPKEREATGPTLFLLAFQFVRQGGTDDHDSVPG
jgi:hypothetical protein